jgi:cytochrome c biogenesis protein
MSVIRNNAEEVSAPPPSPSVPDQIYRFLSSISFTIFLLSFIAISAVSGTLIKQQASPEEYLSRFSESTYLILRFLGLTDVFHARWFLLAIGLFVINLVFCSVGRFIRFMRTTRDVRLPSEKVLSAMPLSYLASGRQMKEVADLFKGYRTTMQNEEGRILEKGRLSRYGVHIIHASIIVILTGSLIGLMFGYRGSLVLAKGETKDTMIRRGGTGKAVPLGFAVKCDDFKVSFYPGGEPREYVSRLQIIDGGKSVAQKEVRVNHPLGYKGTNIYQASYGSNPVLLFNIGGEEVRLSQGSAYKKDKLTLMLVRYEREVHNFGPGAQVAYLDGSEPKLIWFLKEVPKMREKDIEGVQVRLVDIKEEFYTGLEVAKDPGIWVVWTGFSMILFGLYINFFMRHRRIFLLQTAQGVIVAGTSVRNREAFKEEFEKWREKVHAER